MLLYWFMFLIPATWAISRQRPGPPLAQERLLFAMCWILAALCLVAMVGLRHEVGGDWGTYLPYVEFASQLSFLESLQKPDPGYAVLNWLGANLGGGIYSVNTFCGLLFALGVVAFAKQLPRPSLAIAVAMPYLVLVVAMGYSRQGVALGIAMLGLAFLQRGGLWKFMLAICVAGLFHKSAIVLILIALTSRTKHRILTGIAVLSIGAGLYVLLMAEAVTALRVGYVDAEYQSAGAGIRVAMNALPAAIFLWYHRKFQIDTEQRRLWTVISLIALAFIGALVLSPSSTAVDRVALYLIPLQLFVWSHFPDVFGKPGRRNLVGVLLVVIFYATVLFVWLQFAIHSYAWLPYKFYPLELL